MGDEEPERTGGSPHDEDKESTDLPWREYFGFDEPYENQVDAIETAIDTALERGYLAMEGPCGTGKTMAALTVAATLIQTTDRFDNAIIVTPVKQQLSQFVDDLRSLNGSLDDPLSGLALVGKADLCPYEREGIFPSGVSVHDRCEDLREETAALVNAEETPIADTSAKLDTKAPSEASIGSRFPTDPSGPPSSETDTVGEQTPVGDRPEASPQDPPGSTEPTGQDRTDDPTAHRRSPPTVQYGPVGDPDDRWWDPDVASTLAHAANHASKYRASVGDPLETAGEKAPYQRYEPTVPDALLDSDLDAETTYCPFEADWYARDKGSPVGFADGDEHVITVEEFLPEAVRYGTCPHRVLNVLLQHADVVIGNYNHLFDPKTRALTDPVLDDSTFVIVDEAHRIEERVRGLLSDTIGRHSILRARGDVEFLRRYARQDDRHESFVAAELRRYELSMQDLERTRQFYDDVHDWLLDRVDAYFEEEWSGTERAGIGSVGGVESQLDDTDQGDERVDENNEGDGADGADGVGGTGKSDRIDHADGADGIDGTDQRANQTSQIDGSIADVVSGSNRFPATDLEIPLRDPDESEPDELRSWATEQGYGDDTWRTLGTVGTAVEDVIDTISEDRSCVCAPVGFLFEQWWTRDDTTYFREISLEHAPKEQYRFERPWEGYYTPSLLLYNCLPAAELKRIFGRLGGGMIMSATLEPISVFREVTGLNELAAAHDTLECDDVVDSDDNGNETASVTGGGPDVERGQGDETGRPVVERTYDLQYPPDNRASWIVDAPPFTARNRGPPDLDNRNRTREKYAYALRTIARSPGNVLLCLPNYREARWAAARLRETVDKPILLDESSSNEETTELKRSFVDGGDKVLVTSTRGTLTEGVDFDGDKLHACAVVGVPLVNIGSPRVRAVINAYGERFGHENAFEYALTVPAVRRSRQAIGRVIRGPDERGVRIYLGNRYTPDAIHNSVYEYLPAGEREEFVRMTPMFLESQFESFWGNE